MSDMNERESGLSNDELLLMVKQYRFLTENTVECIWQLDLKTNQYKYISPSIVNLRGLSVEEAMAEDFSQSLTPDSLRLVTNLLQEKSNLFVKGNFQEKDLSRVDEIQQYHKNGTIVDVEISTRIVTNHDTGYFDIIGVSRDISDRKSLQRKLDHEINEIIQKLKKSESEYRRIAQQLEEKNERMNTLVLFDNLTGIHNRYYFIERIHEELDRSNRYKMNLSLAIFDLDHFKKVNDRWGHDVGDQVLKNVAQIAFAHIRKPDILCRWGGEEFAILMTHTPLPLALKTAERIRNNLAEYNHPIVGKVTASFGVSEYLEKESYEEWFKRADQSLYRAKEKGRNCVYSLQLFQEKQEPLAFVHFTWNEDWCSGDEDIDQQHKALIDKANELMTAMMTQIPLEKVLVLLDKLLLHLQFHFRAEEILQQKSGYPDYNTHRLCHEALITETKLLINRYRKEGLKASFLFSFVVDDVIIGHLLKEDVKFFPYTRKKG